MNFLPHMRSGRLAFLLALLFLAAGCGTVPSHYVKVLPSPARSFPPVKPALVRLPVEIVFPGGGGVVRHISNFFKGELKQLVPYLLGMPGLHMKSHIADLWAKMQDPIYLDKGIWLLIRPQTLSIGRMRNNRKRASTIHTVLEMTAEPEIVFGPKPPATPVKMPPLQTFEAGPGIFRAMSNTRVSYKEVNQFFQDPRQKLVGMVLPGTGGRKLTLDGIRFYGSGGKVIAEAKLHYNPIINFAGKPAKLTVYLRGTPRYHPKHRVFDFPDLDYDIKSNDLLLQIADWIHKSDFKNVLRRIAKLPIGFKLDEYKEIMDKALNRPLSRYTRLNTQVKSFEVLGGYADNEGIVMRLAVKGTATLDVTWN